MRLLKIAATEERDSEYRREAIVAFNAVKDFLSKLKTSDDVLYLHKHRIEQYGGYYFKASEMQVSGRKQPLIFIFGTKEKISNSGFGWTPDKKYAVIMLNILLKDCDLIHADTRLSKEFFVHEYIHYLDACRRGFPKDKLQSSFDPSKENWTEYFNDSGEMNAYYQESAWGIENLLRVFNKYQPETHADAMKDFTSFYAFCIRYFREDWVKVLTPENTRRVQKRLYGLYENLKKSDYLSGGGEDII